MMHKAQTGLKVIIKILILLISVSMFFLLMCNIYYYVSKERKYNFNLTKKEFYYAT